MSFTTMGDDIAALLDHLKIPKADLVGHSFGGVSAIRAAIQHPEKVRRLPPPPPARMAIRDLLRWPRIQDRSADKYHSERRKALWGRRTYWAARR
jgi:pimeloyl-ACP methyl ester carboxylesterase